MKRFLISIFVLAIINISPNVFAQTQLYFEDFNNGMPNNYILLNQDNIIPDTVNIPPTFSFRIKEPSNTWTTIARATNFLDSAAISTTMDKNTGAIKTTDDWMISPGITIGNYGFLSFESLSPPLGTNEMSFEVWASNTKGDTSTDFSTKIHIANPDTSGFSWLTNFISLKPFGMSNDTIYFAFVNNTIQDGFANKGGYGIQIDNIKVIEVNDRDASLETVKLNNFVQVGDAQTFTGLIRNVGGDTIKSIDLNWNINGGTVKTTSLSGLNIAASILGAGDYKYTHDSMWTAPDTGFYTFKIWTSNLNGLGDMDLSNDTLTVTVYAMSSFPTKRVLVENLTSTSCGFCVDADIATQDIMNTIPNSIGVYLHNNDAMFLIDANTVKTTYNNIPPSGSPRALVDRFQFSDQSYVEMPISSETDTLWKNKTNERLNTVTPVDISMTNTFVDSSSSLQVSVSGKFYAPLNGDYRFNCYIIEDSLVGTGEGYDQVNLRNASAGHPYFGLGDSIKNFAHRKVLRFMLGGPWGSDTADIPSNPMPSNIANGDSFGITYNFTIPGTFDINNISVVGLVQRFDISDSTNRQVLNSMEQSLNHVFGTNINTPKDDIAYVRSYPNPFSTQTNIEILLNKSGKTTIEVFNILGRKAATIVSNKVLTKGIHKFVLDRNENNLADGIYFIRTTIEGTSIISNKLILTNH